MLPGDTEHLEKVSKDVRCDSEWVLIGFLWRACLGGHEYDGAEPAELGLSSRSG